jgi:hypothetical protein
MPPPGATASTSALLWMMKTTPALLAALFSLALPHLADAGTPVPPPVPDNLKVLAPNHVVFVGHALGTQNYVCLPSATAASGVAFTLFTPQATLFDDDFDQALTTHFFSPNPEEHGVIRATWQSSIDTSSIWAKVADGDASTDPRFVAKGAVAWLKLTAVGHATGPDGGDRLTNITFVQRLNTAGGVAPATGCTSLADVGHTAFVPYTADYFFYTDR